eukprot:GFUD01008735.1.p1 GENE.GFUD01008735.1~~GFUD01008735.1.p1  ORF type:complete len:361 (+),score=114.89 GFUD01008735.1:57-1139(+)
MMMSMCKFCSGPRKFTCPRCSVDYCSLKCYQSPAHQDCSEMFYKECVQGELSGEQISKEGKDSMMDILQRMNKEDDCESDDSDDDEDPVDLGERLQGIDLDNADDVWEKLSKDEKKQFDELVKSGDLASVLPEYTPWWKVKVEEKKIRDLSEPEDESYKENCPEVYKNISKFSSICSNPSVYLKYGLLNVLYAYAYAVKYFSGDYKDEHCEFVEIVQLLAKNLDGHNFELADTAVEAAASEVNNHQFLGISIEFSRNVKKDVVEIVKGPTGEDNYYILAALSDLKSQFEKVVKYLKRGKKDSTQNLTTETTEPSNLPIWLRTVDRKPELKLDLVKKHLKKVDFYLSWSEQFYGEFSELSA